MEFVLVCTQSRLYFHWKSRIVLETIVGRKTAHTQAVGHKNFQKTVGKCCDETPTSGSCQKNTTMENINNRLAQHLKANKWLYLVIGILLVTTLYFFFSKNMAASRHAEELVGTKEHFEEQAQQLITKNAKEQLSLMQKTFVWAVRSALIRDNLDEVNQYFNELIKEEDVKEIVLAGRQGEILVSTNKKHEGKPFTDFYPEVMLQISDVYFEADSSFYKVAAPVLSLNTKLGTLFVLYHVEGIHLENKPNAANTDTSSAEQPSQTTAKTG